MAARTNEPVGREQQREQLATDHMNQMAHDVGLAQRGRGLLFPSQVPNADANSGDNVQPDFQVWFLHALGRHGPLTRASHP